jgi:uncharacterized protein (TIGR02996 family)
LASEDKETVHLESRAGNQYLELQRQGKLVFSLRGRLDDLENVHYWQRVLENRTKAERYFRRKQAALCRRGYWVGRHNFDFVAAIEKNPEDDGLRQVYGDWLVDKGEARGDLIVAQIARAARPKERELADHEKRLLETHRWLLFPEGDYDRVRWHLGFIRSLSVKVYLWLPQSEDRVWRQCLRPIFMHPSGLHIEELRLRPISTRSISHVQAWQSFEETFIASLRRFIPKGEAKNLKHVILHSPDPIQEGVRQLEIGERVIAYEVRRPGIHTSE